MDKIKQELLSKAIYTITGQDVVNTIGYLVDEGYMNDNPFSDPEVFKNLLTYLYDTMEMDWMDAIQWGIEKYLDILKEAKTNEV